MTIIVHCPRNEHNIKELRKAVASVHADAVIGYIRNLTCPADQKLQLLKSILIRFKDESSIESS